MKCLLIPGILLVATMCGVEAYAQTYTPIALTGFNNDIIAESGTNAAAVTSTELDLSNHILYSAAFGAANNLAGGMPDNGAITSGTRTWQLAPYASHNGLYLSFGGIAAGTNASGILNVLSPVSYAKLSLLIFSTEENSTVSVALKFTDGSVVSAGAYTVLDWFGGSNAVYAGFGRTTRITAAPYPEDGISGGDPRFYPLDINVPCNSQSKLLQAVSVNFISGSSANARAVILAVAGVAYTPVVVTPAVTAAACNNANGSIALTVTGGTPPFNYAWNTSPAQTAPTASGLAPGNYTCTITDSNNCVTLYSGTVQQAATTVLTAMANVTSVCTGDNVTLSVTATGGTAAGYTWQPGNMTGDTVTTTPTATTTYTVSAQDNAGCPVSATVPVTVKPRPVASFTIAPATVCLSALQTVTFTGAAGNTATYDWNHFAGATVKSGSGAGPFTIQFNTPGSYTLQLQVTEKGCASVISTQSTVVEGPLPAPVVTVAAITGSTITFSWPPVAGAIGYQVAVNGGAYGTPSSGAAGTTHMVTGVAPTQTIVIDVIALGAESCRNSAAGQATAKTLSTDIFIPNSFTPNGDGKNDVFKVYGNGIAGIDMKVFSQWGEEIFESRDNAKGWDGTHRRKQQPVGVYTYVIRIWLTDNTMLVRKGWVHLIH